MKFERINVFINYLKTFMRPCNRIPIFRYVILGSYYDIRRGKEGFNLAKGSILGQDIYNNVIDQSTAYNQVKILILRPYYTYLVTLDELTLMFL